jgi:hypothetical protein
MVYVPFGEIGPGSRQGSHAYIGVGDALTGLNWFHQSCRIAIALIFVSITGTDQPPIGVGEGPNVGVGVGGTGVECDAKG